MAQVFKKTAAITASTEWLFDPINFSQTRRMRMHITVGVPTGIVTDLLDIYLVSRDESGVWEDRMHGLQRLGNAAVVGEETLTIDATVPLSAAEAGGIAMPGPDQATRLGAGLVRNGSLPHFYYGNGFPEYCMKIIFTKGGAGTPSFPVTIRVDAQDLDVGY